MAIIFNFHEINNAVWFDDTVRYITGRFKPVNTDELLSLYNNNSNMDKICHFTFDDGDNSYYECIYPVLKKHNVPSSVFVSPDAAVNRKNFWFQEIEHFDTTGLLKAISEVTGISENDITQYPVYDILKCLGVDTIWEIIDNYRKKLNTEILPCRNMSVNQIKEVESSGIVTIGSHTLHHPIIANEEDGAAEKEIKTSKEWLSDILGHEIKYFAYPNGLYGFDFGEREIGFLKESGYECAFTTAQGRFNKKSDLFMIPRVGISNQESKSYINAKVLFGSYWNIMKEIKPGSEIKNRKSALPLFKHQ
jgi:peptidoglycan/xylan/chitin deacetylase (PgdA/CDA1 family)